MKKLPNGETIHELRVNQKQTLRTIGERYGVSRQAVHKVYRSWAESKGIEWRVRRVPATEEN